MSEPIRLNRCDSPCKNCAERFMACSDHCPKDIRGERGYKVWREEQDRIKKNRKAYYDKPFSKIM